MKAFKYFDLNNNGTVEPEEFAKAIEKIGIMIPTKQVALTFNLSPLSVHPKTRLLFYFWVVSAPYLSRQRFNYKFRISTPSSQSTTSTTLEV